MPDFISLETSVAITPRLQSSHWLTPTMQQPKDRSIFLTNSSCESVLIKKDDHLAEVRNSSTVDMPVKPLPGKAIHPDVFQFSDFLYRNNCYYKDCGNTKSRFPIGCSHKFVGMAYYIKFRVGQHGHVHPHTRPLRELYINVV